MATEYRIGPWIIRPHFLLGGAWEFVHDQYDGPGDGSPEERDDRCGSGLMLEDVLEQITEIEDAP